MIYRGEPDVTGILTAIGLGLALLLVAIILGIIKKFTTDFVVPIMRLRRSKCLAAWREFSSLLTAHFQQFVLYLLFQIVLTMAIGALIVMVVLVTCCCAGCLMLLPYLGTVLLLPVLVFKRAYSLLFFAQFGPEYNVFPPPRPCSRTI
jgi:predicted membrane metal-binding protein